MENEYKKIRVAVTDSSYKHTLGIVRALGKIGVKPYVISTRKWSLSGLSKYAAAEILVSEDYTVEELLTFLEAKKINLIILVGTNSFKKIVPWKIQLESRGIEIITVEKDTQDIAFSKVATYELAARLGVPFPKTVYPKTFEDLEVMKDLISYPCVIKGLYEVGGNIVDYVYDKNDLSNKYKKICKKYNLTEADGLPMLQEYVTGQGCAFFAVYNNGNCGPTFQHKRLREYPISGGASVCAESFKYEALEKYGRMLLDSLNWHGVAMVEFKLNENETPILMEINPKFWGSTDLALDAGVNFPKFLIDIYLGKKIIYSSNYKFPFRYHWPLSGDLFHVFENPKNLVPFLKDLFNPHVKSNISVFDPLPSFYMFFSFLWEIVRRNLRRNNV
jgi:predicted ATP-grasp superfamily ATP-dependent carboligase